MLLWGGLAVLSHKHVITAILGNEGAQRESTAFAAVTEERRMVETAVANR
jgi:hypothetical protein